MGMFIKSTSFGTNSLWNYQQVVFSSVNADYGTFIYEINKKCASNFVQQSSQLMEEEESQEKLNSFGNASIVFVNDRI
ncbi:hypothetical protein [Peribacillus sp. NPDC096540]|uniref:hypothetical protein n=1 Tax=Peribacillus sp. NPDC096540 TaxID=3390612 RepID=UPI003D060ECA